MHELIRESYRNKWSHIPSALSMYDYINTLFTTKCITPDNRIILGKPHGAQAYYLPWRKMNLIKTYDSLNTSIKMGQIPFVDYTIDILGDALGVGAGVAIGDKSTNVWVNIGDGCLQMGNVLEAIQFIGQNNLKNITLTVDYNNAQRCGKCSDIISIEPVFNFMKENGWDVSVIPGHNPDEILTSWVNKNIHKPTAFIYKTIKGNGYPVMIKNIMEWHYKTLDETSFRQLLNES